MSDEGLLATIVAMQPTPEQAARDAIDPYDANARYRGTLLLSGATFAGEEVYLRLFEDNLDDEDPSVRVAAARGLANHGTGRHATMLAAALADRDRLVRVEAARGLQRLHNPAVVNPLIRVLDESGEPSPEVRAEAADALGQYAVARVVPALIRALRDRSLAVNVAAGRSLATLTGQPESTDATAWQAWADGKNEAQLFEHRRPYYYPVYWRPRALVEYLPLVPRPPNEVTATPAGMEPLEDAGPPSR